MARSAWRACVTVSPRCAESGQLDSYRPKLSYLPSYLGSVPQGRDVTRIDLVEFAIAIQGLAVIAQTSIRSFSYRIHRSTRCLPGLVRESVPFLGILIEMGGHNSQLQRFLQFPHVLVTLSEHGPRRACPWLNSNNLLHDPYRLLDVIVDVCLVPFANESSDLLRQHDTLPSPRLLVQISID